MLLTSKNSDMMASMPTRARMTVRSGAAGKVMFVLNSSIWRTGGMVSRGQVVADGGDGGEFEDGGERETDLQQVDDEDEDLVLGVAEQHRDGDSEDYHHLSGW